VLVKDIDNIEQKRYSQKLYVRAEYKIHRRTKRKYWYYDKFRFRTKSRESKTTRYKIKVVIVAKKRTGTKGGKYSGTSHIFSYYSKNNVDTEFQHALNQAKSYALQDLFSRWIEKSDDVILYNIISVKVLRLKYKKFAPTPPH